MFTQINLLPCLAKSISSFSGLVKYLGDFRSSFRVGEAGSGFLTALHFCGLGVRGFLIDLGDLWAWEECGIVGMLNGKVSPANYSESGYSVV